MRAQQEQSQALLPIGVLAKAAYVNVQSAVGSDTCGLVFAGQGGLTGCQLLL